MRTQCRIASCKGTKTHSIQDKCCSLSTQTRREPDSQSCKESERTLWMLLMLDKNACGYGVVHVLMQKRDNLVAASHRGLHGVMAGMIAGFAASLAWQNRFRSGA